MTRPPAILHVHDMVMCDSGERIAYTRA